MHDGEGLLGIPWLGPFIFQIRKLRPCLESDSQRLGCSVDPRAKGGLRARAGPSQRGCLAPGSRVPLGISDRQSPRRQCEASGRQASPQQLRRRRVYVRTLWKEMRERERQARQAAANTWPGSPASCLPAMASWIRAILSGPSPIPSLLSLPSSGG